MRFAGTCSRYSNNAMPHDTSAAMYQGLVFSSFRWAYHAKVMNTFDSESSSAVCQNAAGGVSGCVATVSGTNVITGTVGTFPSGGSVQVLITGTVPAAATGTLSNQATVSPPSGLTDPTPGNNTSATVTTTLTRTSDLAVDASAPAAVGSSGGLTYTVLVWNNGPSVTSAASVPVTLPAGFTVTGLTNGLPVYCVVVAENAAGLSQPSNERGLVPTAAGQLGGLALWEFAGATGSESNAGPTAAAARLSVSPLTRGPGLQPSTSDWAVNLRANRFASEPPASLGHLYATNLPHSIDRKSTR